MDPEMRETMEQNTAKRAELAQARDALRSLEKKAKKRCQDCGSCQKRELEEVIREKTAYKAMFETENTTAKRCQLATYAMVQFSG